MPNTSLLVIKEINHVCPQGSKGKRIRKRFATKGEATAFERYTMNEIDDKP
ncbi:MAG: hypothetical protein HRT97_08290 [Moritella sp.]|uniref:hypothetical protein n=1 Tax=Moritella sp. TaxID=78556 RepID=UPI0025DECD87|nr:hypothetical protein [Moritella sp.]NQZ92324.1 hypothetical protein [Moritella sp.]